MAKVSSRRKSDPIGQMSLEEHFLAFGGERPAGFGLHNVQTDKGMEARAGLAYLLHQVDAPGAYAEAARNILQSCACPEDYSLDWADLRTLPSAYWNATIPLLNYIWRTGGLKPDDFEDRGTAFIRAVFQQEQTTAFSEEVQV